ncbi:MAG: hypothetical protein R3B09_10145 [Nannocystaceae bacterium]
MRVSARLALALLAAASLIACGADDSGEGAASASEGITSVSAGATSASAGGSTDASGSSSGSTGDVSASATTSAGATGIDSASTSDGASTATSDGTSASTSDGTTDATTSTSDGTTDATATTDPDTTTGELIESLLLDLPGDAFTPTEADTMARWDFGEEGLAYHRVTVSFDLVAGGWQPEIPDEGDPDRTEHILFGLFRAHQTKSDQRYLMGAAAVHFAGSKKPHFRMFGRNALASGYMTYVQWSGTYLWQEGGEYHVECVLDGVIHEERCTLALGGEVVAERVGAIDYLDPAAHLTSGLYLELGREPPGDIETAPIGWVYRDVKVIGAHP